MADVEMQMEPAKKKSNTALWIILSVVLAAIVFGAGGYYLGTQKTDETTPTPTVTVTTTAKTSATASNTVSPSTTATSTSVSKEQAVEKVKNLPAVKDYLTRVPQGVVEFDHEDTAANTWVIHVYAMGDDASATFNWYDVNKANGDIKAEF